MYREAEQGVPVRQFDCFDDIVEIDGHLGGLIAGRVDAVAGCEMVVRPGAPDAPSELAAAALGERIRNIGFREFIEHHLTAPHYGIACTNIVWDLVDGVVAPMELINASHRRFASPTAERAHEIHLVDGDDSRKLTPLEYGLWAVTRMRGRNPWASGSLRTCAWWAMFKRWSVRDWQVFAEMFGLPLVLGYYEEGAGIESRRVLEDAAKNIGEDGFAILSSLTELIVKDTVRSGDSSTVYPQIAALAEAQMSKRINGATLINDSGGPGSKGSYALGGIHESQQYKRERRDAGRIEEMFARDIGIPFVRWNGYDRAAPPELKIQITRDSLERAQTLEIVGAIIDLDEGQLREEFSLRTPAPGKGVRVVSAKSTEGAPGGKPPGN